ncbi:MAG: tyrosine--tRNA ligase [Candidatus Thorarchaeota archaeon]|jgi:tyrosyl-tRNA synthetase
MDVEKRLELIKRNTEEIVSEKELRDLLKKKKKPVVYLGTAITGRPHVAYFLPMLKLSDFLKAGFHVKLLLADLHGALDGTPWEHLENRYNYYAKVIPLMIQAIGANTKELEIVKGSEFQLKPEYSYDVLVMSSHTTIHDAKKAASEVVKFGKNPKLAGTIYPIMQALDEQYLKADVQYGGTDQRKIMMFARDYLPKIGYNPRIEVMTPIIPGLIGKKMSASEEKSKIDLLDDEKTVKNKIRNAEMSAGSPDNGVMQFLKYVIMTIKQDKKHKFIIKREKKYGGNLSYDNYEDVERDFVKKKLHPLDIKNSVAEVISDLLKTIQKDKKVYNLAKKAYSV